ncbi:prepilin-type N-terminal cleavage/methylation domain-containing protein [Marinomonas sp. M1K-6]|uniref:Type II secretion system protein H n=1 Tax=Marinomonas profundi TaxID=2726122 RepID=A0A847R3B6_9GAMM|nr:GspH/FimT family pseudopilin [Marinomonas profundi]NLQ18421.1 prepilin-type N-terminal cleavage/methylation domain-containing protein [Marinomonas profundi]UDV02475.1 GspH/FimT family pseudopilin [Marinomonas profundi]
MGHQHGFSLLELLCVLAIISILAYVGSTPILSMSQKSKDKSTLNDSILHLANALTQARQLAVLSGQASFLCGGVACDGHWSSGFKLYQIEPVSGVEKTYRQIVFDASLQVSWRGFPVKKQQIEFQSNGLSGYQNGTFVFCLGVWQADLVLNQSGRFYLTGPEGQKEGQCQ